MTHGRKRTMKALLSLLLFFAAGINLEAISTAPHHQGGRGEWVQWRGSTPRGARTNADGKERHRTDTRGSKDASAGQWTLIGPQPLIGPDGESDTGTMAHSGLVYAVGVDPRNSSAVVSGSAGILPAFPAAVLLIVRAGCPRSQVPCKRFQL